MITIGQSDLIKDTLMASICEGLIDDGFAIIDDAFSAALLTDLQLQLASVSADEFKAAGIGRADDYQTNSAIRRDKILWLDDELVENLSYFEWVKDFRLALNRYLFLGLFDYECLFAHYPVGAFYQKHVDTFKSDVLMGGTRKISTVLYLNPNWQPEDGGELLLYRPEHELPFERILPELGRLVVFLSEEIPHEVLPANRSRYSLTGWFKTQS